MKLDQLQNAWQAHYQKAAASQPSIITAETMKTSAKFESTLVWRDWIETCAAVFVIVMFGSTLFKDDLSLLSVLGVLIIIASTLRVIWVLHSTRKRQSTVPPDHSLLECARVEIERVEVQIKLLHRVTLWHTTPLTVGAIVFVYGLMEPWWVASIAAGGFLVIFILVGLVIHRMNQQCVKLSLIPLRVQLLDLIESLESTSVD